VTAREEHGHAGGLPGLYGDAAGGTNRLITVGDWREEKEKKKFVGWFWHVAR
jgi:hypothetical protein